MNRKVAILAGALLCSSAVGSGCAGVFLRGNAGWMEQDVYKTDTAGSPYMGGSGWSGEAGIGLSGRMELSFEYGPSYAQPVRDIDESEGLEDGAYRLMMGNLTFRMEPIESLRPYFYLGGGRGVFTFDYGDTGRVFSSGGVEKRLKEETLKSWVVAAGLGFEAPITGRLFGGARGRFLYHRWQAATDTDRFLPFDSGNGYSIDGTLTIRF